MDWTPVDKLAALLEDNPRDGQALVLYGLFMTLSSTSSGAMFTLAKFRDLDAEHRQIAYYLIELMAQGATHEPQWRTATERMTKALAADG